MKVCSYASFSIRGLQITALCGLIGAAAPAQNPTPSQPQDPQQPAVIKVETALVTLPVIVTDRFGRFITGLEQRDFSVREDEARQEIATFSSTEAPFNVALLLDTSHSTKQKLGAIRKAALTFVKQLQPTDRVMIVTFDDQVRFVCELTSDRERLKTAIESVKSQYATSLYDAILLTVTQKLAPLPGRKAIVVLTDGVDTASRKGTFDSTLDLIATAGVIAYPIQYETRNAGGPVMKPILLPNSFGFVEPSGSRPSGVSGSIAFGGHVRGLQAQDSGAIAFASSGLMPTGQGGSVRGALQSKRDPYLIAKDFLRALAMQSGATYHQAETIESTAWAFALIANELRHQYTLTYYSSNDQRDGRIRTIRVNVRQRDLLVRTRQAYRAPRSIDQPERPPSNQEDQSSPKRP